MNFIRYSAAILALVAAATPSVSSEAGDTEARYFAQIASTFERAGMPVAGYLATAAHYRDLVGGSFERSGMRLPVAENASDGYDSLIRASFERQEMAAASMPCHAGS